jgi:hypothetical protein
MNNTPWLDEPTESRWIDEATGLPCFARRFDNMHSWNGYVGFPTSFLDRTKTHAVRTSPHGGVLCHRVFRFDSLADAVWFERAGYDPLRVWWAGFDCAWASDGDLLPCHPQYGGTWRSLDFVRTECAKLARAIRDAMEKT